MKKSSLYGVLAGSFACLTLVSVAPAAPMSPGQSAVATPDVAPGGTEIDQQSQPFLTGNYGGTLISRVLQNDPTNPLGGLTFTYQLVNDLESANALTRLTVTGYGGYATDIGYQNGTGTVAPTFNDRSLSGDVVGFTFMGPPIGLGLVSPGSTSELLIVQTNSTGYQSRIANVINGAVSTVNGFSPAGAITPEPTLAVGALAAGLVFTRRRRA